MNAIRVVPRLARTLLAYRLRREVVAPPPIRLWVESASGCNLRCPMCHNKDVPAGRKGLMEIGLFRKIVAEAGDFVNDIYLHHRGEPLLNPALPEMISLARAAGIRTRFHTNGALLTEERAGRLLDAGPNLVSFSVDAFEKEGYETVRVGALFEETVENILRFARMRRDRGLTLPYLVVERIRFADPAVPENPAAIADLRRRFLEGGVDEVIEKDEYRWTTEGMPELEGPPASKVCTFPWYSMVVCADGTVTPCPQDYFAKMAMGNVKEASLREIWNGEPYRDLRRRFRTDLDSLPLCRKCDRLRRKTVGGIPFQYLATFLIDQVVGYNRIRRWMGTAERR
jgi:radical SAM protein with 4Fe4S-binding SPASM domain